MSNGFQEDLRKALAADYRLEGEVGRGGMAVVYRAVDLRHDRPVAIKVIRPDMSHALAANRFLREIRLAARLSHPRILPVYASGEAAGVLFYVMPFVDAPTLREHLEKAGGLPVREAVGIARDVARALVYAHEQGVVHRDIKPENIMLPAGEAVVTDFGVARALSDSGPSDLTETGAAIGTPIYMSPEQAFGTAEAPADVYSLGCVLYEMLAGRPPFDGPTALAIFASHSTAPLPPIAREDVPGALVDAVNRSMAKDPEDRPSAADLEDALRRAMEEPGSVSSSFSETAVTRAGRAVAVLPLADLSPERAFGYLCEGIAEELLSALSRLPGLRVLSRTSAFALRDPAGDIREKARRLGVEAVLEGSVQAAGERIRVSVQLTNVNDGFQVWSHRFDGTLADLFAIEDEISRAVVEALRIEMAGPPATMIGAPTDDVEAHRQYLLGRQAWNERTPAALAASVERFSGAVGRDPTFAIAHAALAEAKIMQAVYGAEEPHTAMSAARAAASRALELTPGLGEALSARASVAALYDWSWEEAERGFIAATQRHPGYVTARQWYAMHLLAPLGRFADARAELERARLLDPLSPVVLASLGQVALFSGDPAEAIGHHRSALEFDADFAPAHFFLGQAYLETGDIAAAVAEFDLAARVSGESSEVIAFQALGQSRSGHPEAARRLLDTLSARSETTYVSPVLQAIALLGLGQPERALEELERAAATRATDLVWLGVRSIFAELYDVPGFQALLARLGLRRP
ncbi:MAG: protein kinase [Gemmatimonadales bacterium]